SLFAGGVPCPPFSKASRQLGHRDERDLFPAAMRLIRQCAPRAVMLENVRGLLDAAFDDYRAALARELNEMDRPYTFAEWRLLNASDFGVPQLRPRAVLVALQEDVAPHFRWPGKQKRRPPTIGEALGPLMAAAGWKGAEEWAARANSI